MVGAIETEAEEVGVEADVYSRHCRKGVHELVCGDILVQEKIERAVHRVEHIGCAYVTIYTDTCVAQDRQLEIVGSRTESRIELGPYNGVVKEVAAPEPLCPESEGQQENGKGCNYIFLTHNRLLFCVIVEVYCVTFRKCNGEHCLEIAVFLDGNT